MKRIIIGQREREQVREAFGVTDKTISLALNFRQNNDLAMKIRTLALQKGGVLADPDEMTTIFESDGNMVQTWGDRYRLVVDRSSGDVRVFVDGVVKHHYRDMSIVDLMKEQRRISLLSATR